MVAGKNSPLKISVLDSSFNPPTLAHLALASLSPDAYCQSTLPAGSADTPGVTSGFDARLLLLSVRNADKGLKPTDATYVQRLEMMIHLADAVVPDSSSHNATNSDPHTAAESNVAVAIIDEPTFVGKERILTEFLRAHLASLAQSSSPESSARATALESPPQVAAELTFIVGMDTLERILAPRYYPSYADMRGSLKQFMSTSRLVCSRRIIPGQLSSAQVYKEKEIMALAKDYLDILRLTVVDIGEEIEAYSSSEVRKRVGERDASFWTRMVTPDIAKYIRLEGLYNDMSSTNAL